MPHEPTRACDADHCYIHNEDEPAESALAIVCGECGHMYPDAVELVTADARLRQELELTPLPVGAVSFVLTAPESVFQVIPTCPTCAHDF